MSVHRYGVETMSWNPPNVDSGECYWCKVTLEAKEGFFARADNVEREVYICRRCLIRKEEIAIIGYRYATQEKRNRGEVI